MNVKECYELMKGNYEDTVSRLLTDARIKKYALAFTEDESFAKMEDAIDQENAREAFYMAHTLKGIALNLGFSPLAESSSSLCELLRNAETISQEAFDESRRVAKDYEMVVSAVKQLAESLDIVVCVGKGAQRDLAESIARKIGAPVSEKPGEQLSVCIDRNGVSLQGYGLTYRGDFEEMLHRLTNGRLQHEMLAKVVKTKDEHPSAIDATAGMGEDSIILAACGYQVTLFEQNPVVAALLKDAMRRARKHPVLGEIVGRMNLIEGDSIEYMNKMVEGPDLIYLDPMFPARQKSGLINKKLQLIQKLETPCTEEVELLEAAIAAKPKKIVIKRPLKGANLAGREPGYSIKGKAIRYDCIVL